MSFESTAALHRKLLPDPLEQRLLGWVAKCVGLLLLGACLTVALSLVTWSVDDPSLTHATSGKARNLLGPLGAILSDLLMQMLGLAGMIAILPVAYWASLLVTQRRVPALKLKLILAPLAILALAGALSSLPRLGSWPLQHGFGGILGDLCHKLLAGLVASVNPGRAGLAAGLFCFAGGLFLLSTSLGLSCGDLLSIIIPRRRPRSADKRSNAASERPPMPPLTIDPFAAVHAEYARAASGSWTGQRPPATRSNNPSPPQRRHETEQCDRDVDPAEGRRDAMFEASTEITSRTMAERFAPPGAEPQHWSPSTPNSAKAQAGGFLSGIAGGFRKPESHYKRPPLTMLKRPAPGRTGAEISHGVLQAQARMLEDTLADFGVKGEIKDAKPGPVVTLFELEPARGTKSSRVIGLADDIARSMSAIAVRVAVVPGRNVIGIELPNPKRETVYLRELIEAESFKATDAKLPMILGKTIGGEPIVADLARMPHLLIAGTTGSGKSVGVNAMILSLLYRLDPSQCRMIMIDPKMLELSVYNGIPHLLTPVVTDPHKAVAALNWVVSEMEERYKSMAKLAVRNIDVFNNRVRNAQKHGERLARTVQTGFNAKSGQAIYEKEQLDLQPMPYIVVVVDEFADLMAVAGKEIEFAVQRLAQMARAAGIHLIMATQRPSVDIITGTIKANFPTRISFKVTSKIDSRTILNEQGAEQLLGQGDMLYAAGTGQVLRVHGPFVSDEEVESIAAFLREQGEPRYVTGITDGVTEVAPTELEPRARSSDDDLYDRAITIVLNDQKASTSYIQRRLSIGYNRAADLIERMERDGLVGPANHAGKRAILSAPSAPPSQPAINAHPPTRAIR